MKHLKLAFLIIALTSLANCSSVDSDPTTGIWNVTMDSPVGAIEALLTIIGDGTGSLAGDMFGVAPTTDVAVNGEMLTFSATVNAQGQTIPLTFSGSVIGDVITGSFDSSFGAIPLTGSRQE